MASVENKIPLFPLNIVLFPQSRIPLYIFEKRYKNLIRDCIENEELFGINFTDKNKLSAVGCSAVIEEVLDTKPEGEMDIIVKGEKRYKTLGHTMSDTGYYVANVEYLKNVNINYDESTFEKAIDLYNQLILTIFKGSIATINKFDIRWKDGSNSVSFYMAQKCGLNLEQRQKLLEMNEESDRLEYVCKYLEEVTPLIKEADKVAKIIKGNGYVQ